MTFPSFHANAQSTFDPTPTTGKNSKTKVSAAKSRPQSATCIGIPISVDGAIPSELGIDRKALNAAAFEGKVGQTLILPQKDGTTLIAFGIGHASELDVAKFRDAAAAFARAAKKHEHIALWLFDDAKNFGADIAAQAAAEGALLARYRYLTFKHDPKQETPLKEFTILSASADPKRVEAGLNRGAVAARAAMFARDLANAPATLLTARRMAEIAESLAHETGLEIEVFDEEQLLKLGCGGILGVNAGSAEPPRMIKLTYRPKDTSGKSAQPSGRIALIGKGIMYDSGGISLKPNDLVHATMKGDMSGAAAILAAMTTLSSLGCKAEVTSYLMCTDNMPGGAAMKLGDILTVRGGTQVEVMNTDAEGRLVMADALVLATEQDPRPDAIVDIATLTGACQRALGVMCAGVMGNNQSLIDQLETASDRSDESIWQLPLDRRYRKELESEIADMKNVGGDNAGAITAALFLDEFVSGLPWAHIDIAGTARFESEDSWRTRGATGFGARLLVDFLLNFTPPQADKAQKKAA